MSSKEFVPRVSQIDSIVLDKEVIEVLKLQLANVSKVDNGYILSHLAPEIYALLRLYIWKISVGRSHSTFGQQMLNLKYEGNFSATKSYLWCALIIIPSYISDKLDNGFKFGGRNKRSYNMLGHAFHWIRVLVRIANILNLLMFLKGGKYTSPVERILKMEMVYASKESRNVGYNYMTRELIWHTLIELLGNMLPLINYYSLKRKLFTKFSQTKKSFLRTENLVLSAGMKCAICQDSPVLPHHIGCSHVFCFYCIQGNLLADSGFQCPSCSCSVEEGASPLAVPYK